VQRVNSSQHDITFQSVSDKFNIILAIIKTLLGKNDVISLIDAVYQFP
jgi:hypothetical protein